MTAAAGRPSVDPGATVGVDIDYPWEHLGKFETEIRKASGRRSLTFYPTRLGRIRVTFSTRPWGWMKPGMKAEELARTLANAGFPVAGGFISRTDFWHAQAAIDHRIQAPRAADDLSTGPINSAAMLARLVNPLHTVTVIELLDSPGTLSESDRGEMQRGLLHHHPNAMGRSRLGRGQIVLNYRGHHDDGALVSAGESIKAVNVLANKWPLVSVRVCRSRDWFTERALDTEDGSTNTDIAGPLQLMADSAGL